MNTKTVLLRASVYLEKEIGPIAEVTRAKFHRFVLPRRTRLCRNRAERQRGKTNTAFVYI
jgi:hypothetical protein